MDLIIRGKNVELNDTAREYIDRKIGKLAKYLDTMLVDATVEVSVESTRDIDQRHVAQVTLTANGTILRAEERGPDLRTAVDAVADVMQRQVVRFKERVYGKGQGGRAAAAQPVSPELETALLEDRPRIVRTKQFAVKPMPPEEAAEQMELLGHDFYVFLNEDSCQVNVVYRRRDGNYGLIEPEVA
ncbi:MAG: ribosome-associated translation inhibitor RaiA [Bacteroidetes bacterium]|nr:ribosome-associated translation inhibitor RaiA [Bacteroidota bacterium]MCL5027367.1 ribosome-associated translation inhibitor RaiA [Chloroflexota bacterium]